MTFQDFIEVSAGNLWRTKLRSSLTVAGVVIAIATFVSMLSFGAGNQRFITDFYVDFGLFTNIHVYPVESDEQGDTSETAVLDREAIGKLAAIPGVNLAYPFDAFEVTASVGDTQIRVQARAVPVEATGTKLFSKILGGSTFSSDTAKEAFVAHELISRLNIDDSASLVGRRLVISARAASLDSALLSVFDESDESLRQRLSEIDFDSMRHQSYRGRIMRRELSESVRRFVEGFTDRQITVSDTLIIVGVGKETASDRINIAPVIIPEGTARMLTAGGFGLGSNPTELYEAARSGKLFASETADQTKTYPSAFLEIDPYASAEEIQDSVEALGFRTFSYAEQFENLQRFFLYYNLGLAVIGLIAIATAALGIINTMVMSIMERRREIGVLKSLGADEREIKLLFLVESGVIGAVGAMLGIFCGWVASRAVSAIMRMIMEREGMPVFDPFALPVWLVVTAFLFGIAVSLAAGLYPASRAARVDPVEALRGD